MNLYRRLRCKYGWHKQRCTSYTLSPPYEYTVWSCEWCPDELYRADWAEPR